MGCGGIIANISNRCDAQPVRGLVRTAYVFNRSDFTYDSDLINSHLIDNIAGTGYRIVGYRQDLDAGFDLVQADNRPDNYIHYFKCEPWDENADQVKNLDSLEDLVIIVEVNGASNKFSGDGAFWVLGLEKGLFKNSANQRANDNSGIPIYELTSLEGKEEKYSKWVYYDTSYAYSKSVLEMLTSGAPSNWILNGGVWSDSGVWDDTAAWED